MKEQTTNEPTETNLDNVDNEISALSTRLFAIDDKSQKILALIARNGPMTVYELCKSSNRSLSKTSIHRRIYGERQLISLLDENFLRLEGKTKFLRISTSLDRKYYGLTLKGFLAALSKVPCEEIYMFKIFERLYGNEPSLKDSLSQKKEEQRKRLWASLRNRIRYDLMIFLQYHHENGFQLTHLRHPNLYFAVFCDQTVPLRDSRSDFLSFRSESFRYFSPEWERIWKDRTRAIEATKTSFTMRVWDLDSKKEIDKPQTVYFGEALYPPGWDWIGVFNSCWWTKEEYAEDSDKRVFLLDTLHPFMEAYNTVIGGLRNGKIPWPVEEIMPPSLDEERDKQPRMSRKEPRQKQTRTVSMQEAK